MKKPIHIPKDNRLLTPMAHFESNSNRAVKKLPQADSGPALNAVPGPTTNKAPADFDEVISEILSELGGAVIEKIEAADGVDIKTVFRVIVQPLVPKPPCAFMCQAERTLVRCDNGCERAQPLITLFSMAVALRMQARVCNESILVLHTRGCPECGSGSGAAYKIVKISEIRFANPTEE